MREQKKRFNFKLKLFAGLILAFMAFTAIYTDFETGGNGIFAGTSILMTAGAVAIPQLSEKETAFLAVVKEELRKEVDKFDKGYLTESKFNESIKGIIDDAIKEKPAVIKELYDIVEAQGVELTQMKNGTHTEQKQSFSDVMKKNLLELNKDKFEAMKKSMSGNITFDIPLKSLFVKTVGDMSSSASATGTTNMWESILDTVIEGVPNHQTILLNLLPKVVTGKKYINWVERTGGEGGPNPENEGTAYDQTDYDYIEKQLLMERVGHFINVTQDMLDDWDALLSDIQSELVADLLEKINDMLYNGTGAAPQWEGLFNATAANSTALVTTSITRGTTPNIADLINIASAQIMKAKFNPTFALINPGDYDTMLSAKTTTGAYVFSELTRNGAAPATLRGVTIFPSSAVTADTLLVGDVSKAKVYFNKNAQIKMYDQHGENAAKDMVMIKASAKGNLRVKSIHTTAFVKVASIATALTAITESAG